MSGTASLSSGPLTDGEKVDVRRFCGYPAIGSRETGQESWRFFQVEERWNGGLTACPAQNCSRYVCTFHSFTVGNGSFGGV